METKTQPHVGLALFLVAGPLLTIYGVVALERHSDVLAGAPLHVWVLAALVLWSPLPISLPAVLLDSARDAALPGYSGFGRIVRAVKFVPYMLTKSPARLEFAASLLGFVGACSLAVTLI